MGPEVGKCTVVMQLVLEVSAGTFSQNDLSSHKTRSVGLCRGTTQFANHHEIINDNK